METVPRGARALPWGRPGASSWGWGRRSPRFSHPGSSNSRSLATHPSTPTKQINWTETGEIFWDFFMYILYSTLLYLPPLRFHCVGGCWGRTQDTCDFGYILSTRLHLIHNRLYLIHDSASSHPRLGYISSTHKLNRAVYLTKNKLLAI